MCYLLAAWLPPRGARADAVSDAGAVYPAFDQPAEQAEPLPSALDDGPLIDEAQNAGPDPTEGFGVVSLPLELGILDVDSTHRDRRYAGGITLRIVGRRNSFP